MAVQLSSFDSSSRHEKEGAHHSNSDQDPRENMATPRSHTVNMRRPHLQSIISSSPLLLPAQCAVERGSWERAQVEWVDLQTHGEGGLRLLRGTEEIYQEAVGDGGSLRGWWRLLDWAEGLWGVRYIYVVACLQGKGAENWDGFPVTRAWKLVKIQVWS